jgi:cyclopropane-fatty-acyl-phospholipid synthase
MTARNIATALPIRARTVVARLTDKGAAWHIAKDPRVGAGEAYMDGRSSWKRRHPRPHPPHPLQCAVRKQGALKPKGPLRRTSTTRRAGLDQINWKSRSRRNAEHTYNLTRKLYELFLDEDRQYTCAYYRDPATAWSRRSSTRRRTSRRSFT